MEYELIRINFRLSGKEKTNRRFLQQNSDSVTDRRRKPTIRVSFDENISPDNKSATARTTTHYLLNTRPILIDKERVGRVQLLVDTRLWVFSVHYEI